EAGAATYTVDNAGDGTATASNCTTPVAGACRLRDAVAAANVDTALDTIAFNIPISGIVNIVLSTGGLIVLHPVFIDGYTQPLSRPNGLTLSDDAFILIHVDGAGLFSTCLQLYDNGSTVRGLSITNCGIAIDILGDGHTIAGNFIGPVNGGVVNQIGVQLQG